MEDFPVEIIGNILSLLGAARDVVIASFTCRKWGEARRNHLHTLKFNSNDWPGYDGLSSSTLEVIITQTIFQTKALQHLSIIIHDNIEFSATPVIAWLMYTRESLRELHYNVYTPNLDILAKCGHQRLELLDLAENIITGFESSYQKFRCLRSLSLRCVSISALDLSHLLSTCPKVEVLNLVDVDFSTSIIQHTLRLSSSSLIEFLVKDIQLSEIILEADSLEKLRIQYCYIGIFKLLSKGSLRLLEMDEVGVYPPDIGDSANNLEIVEVSNSKTLRSNFHHMIKKTSKVRRMSLCFVGFPHDDEVIDTDTASACFPQLSHLSLTFELREALKRGLLGSGKFENVVVLELGWEVLTDLFSDWVVELLERCPNLKKLVIFGAVSREESCILGNFTSFILRHMRKYSHVDVQFKYV